jgi:hypothetical protein
LPLNILLTLAPLRRGAEVGGGLLANIFLTADWVGIDGNEYLRVFEPVDGGGVNGDLRRVNRFLNQLITIPQNITTPNLKMSVIIFLIVAK